MVRQTSIKDKHHGGEFNVFACSKLLNNVDTLNGILKEDADIECISDTITALQLSRELRMHALAKTLTLL